jgi:hypothetical protein
MLFFERPPKPDLSPDPLAMDQIPDFISFGDLQKLRNAKTDRLDFSNPIFSPEIGDLAFYITSLLALKLPKTNISQQILLVSVLLRNLRVTCKEQINDRIREDVSPTELKVLMQMFAAFDVAEDIVNREVSRVMEGGRVGSPMPSYRLVKSLDPTVKPHEIEDWIKGLQDNN